jgi:DNA-directed RNA polymerase subunit RPC12/RpoP
MSDRHDPDGMSGVSDSDLAAFGWKPGDDAFRCMNCSRLFLNGARRATCCRSCAMDRYAKERPPVEDQISPWMPEQDRLTLAVLTKLAEECNELAGRAVRCIAQGIDEDDPKTGLPNREELKREIADVIACINMAENFFGLAFLSRRTAKKLDGYRRWHEMIRARAAETELKEPATDA